MDIRIYMRALKKRLWLIIFCVVVATVTTGYYTYKYYKPFYQANSKLIVNQTFSNPSGDEIMDVGAMASNIRLIDTYKEIIKSTAIMNKVVAKYPDLNLTPDMLVQMVNVYSVNQTQIMIISVVGGNYAKAAELVNAVSTVFQAEVPRIMKINNVTLLTEAPVLDNPQPVNHPLNSNLALSFVISLLFAVGIIFLLEYLDDTLKTEEDIFQVFEVPTLTSVIKIQKKDMVVRNKTKNRIKAGEGPYAAANR